MSKLDTTLTRDWQRKDKPVPQDQHKETVHFSDVAGRRNPQQLAGDDDNHVSQGNVPAWPLYILMTNKEGFRVFMQHDMLGKDDTPS